MACEAAELIVCCEVDVYCSFRPRFWTCHVSGTIKRTLCWRWRADRPRPLLDCVAFVGCKLRRTFERRLRLGLKAEVFPSLAVLIVAWHGCWLRLRRFCHACLFNRLFRCTGHSLSSGSWQRPVRAGCAGHPIIWYIRREWLPGPPTFLARSTTPIPRIVKRQLRRTSDDNLRYS